MKSGNFNFLEHSGPLHACNGTDLPFTFMTIESRILRRMKNVSKLHRRSKHTFFMFNNVFPKIKPFMSQSAKILYSQTGYRWQNNYCAWALRAEYLRLQTLAQNMLYNTYCFSTKTMVMRTRLDIIRTPPVLRSLFQASIFRRYWLFFKIGEKDKIYIGETTRPRHFSLISRLTFVSSHSIILTMGIGLVSVCFCQFEQRIGKLVQPCYKHGSHRLSRSLERGVNN